jgi:hypothetical protein
MFNKPLTLKQIGMLLIAILAFVGAFVLKDAIQVGALLMAGMATIGSLADGEGNSNGPANQGGTPPNTITTGADE